MVMPAGIPQQFVLIACAIAQVGLLHAARRAKLRDEAAPEFEAEIAELSVDASEYGAKWHDDPEAKAAFRRTAARLTVATAYLSGVFAALNAGLTTLHATGAVDLGDWPRLLLILSVLAAGVLYDLHGRSYMNIIMTCAAMLSTLSFFLLITDANGGNVLAATMIFYLGSGFFVVFFTAKFAAVSMYARWAYLWPCMGRVINNICTLLVTAPAVAIISSQNVLTAVAVVLVLLSSLLAACVTAFAGPISFVGIAVPHLVKNLLGSAKPLYVLPGCCLGGAAFCLLCDLIARSLFAPTELSISSVTAVFGAPVVIWLLVRRQTQEGRE